MAKTFFFSFFFKSPCIGASSGIKLHDLSLAPTNSPYPTEARLVLGPVCYYTIDAVNCYVPPHNTAKIFCRVNGALSYHLKTLMFRFLFVIVAGGDEWKLVAEKLALSRREIRFLDTRTLNPVDALLGFITNQRYLSVGELYQILCDCELPAVADLL